MSAVRILEVGPRDGLQNEKKPIPLEMKLRFIASLAKAGLSEIEATSFVSPKWVPQLGDAAELWPKLPPGPAYSALVPNLRGLQTAEALGVQRIAVFTAASESFTKANINMSIAESIEQFRVVARQFREAAMPGWVRAYVSTAFQCPYEGRIAPEAVIRVCESLLDIGIDELCLGDTIGVAAPPEVRTLSRALTQAFGEGIQPKLAWHFHDTWGVGLANVSEALDLGYRTFDASAGGLGGCPYAPGAGGNLATEDLVYLLERQGLKPQVDLTLLALASQEILGFLGKSPTAKAQIAALAKCGDASVSTPKVPS